MKSVWESEHYCVHRHANNFDGFVRFVLSRQRPPGEAVATLTYWDAMGQFMLELNEDEVSLILLDILVREAKRHL